MGLRDLWGAYRAAVPATRQAKHIVATRRDAKTSVSSRRWALARASLSTLGVHEAGSCSAGGRPGHERHRPEETLLYRLVAEHLETFLAEARENHERALPRYVSTRSKTIFEQLDPRGTEAKRPVVSHGRPAAVLIGVEGVNVEDAVLAEVHWRRMSRGSTAISGDELSKRLGLDPRQEAALRRRASRNLRKSGRNK